MKRAIDDFAKSKIGVFAMFRITFGELARNIDVSADPWEFTGQAYATRDALEQAARRRWPSAARRKTRAAKRRKQSQTPPLNAEKLLYLFLAREQREYLIGDLEEEFQTVILPKYGPGFARVWYWKQTLSSLAAVLGRRVAKWAALVWVGKAATWVLNKFGS